MASKKVTLSADGATATVADATFSDIFSTLVSTDSKLTGAYGLLQDVVKVGAGMMVQNYRVNGSINIFRPN